MLSYTFINCHSQVRDLGPEGPPVLNTDNQVSYINECSRNVLFGRCDLDIVFVIHKRNSSIVQSLHRLEKYKSLEKSLNFTLYRRIQHCLW